MCALSEEDWVNDLVLAKLAGERLVGRLCQGNRQVSEGFVGFAGASSVARTANHSCQERV